jgi:hypothetical protein
MFKFPLRIEVYKIDETKWVADVFSSNDPVFHHSGETPEHALGKLMLQLSEIPGFNLWTFDIRFHAEDNVEIYGDV